MKWMILVSAVALTGCAERPTVANCVEHIKTRLKAPSTFKSIDVSGVEMKDESPPQYWLTIQYDAQNSYGALLRGSHTCRYPLRNGDALIDERMNDPDDDLAARLDQQL